MKIVFNQLINKVFKYLMLVLTLFDTANQLQNQQQTESKSCHDIATN